MAQIQVAMFTSSLIKEEHNFLRPRPGTTTILKAGSIQGQGHRPLLCDILVESHVPITLRDGVVIHANIYRPPNVPFGTVPAIIAAGPFGKDGGPNKINFNKWPWRFGCHRSETSGFGKFEGPDPGYWCYHGYAIVHTGKS
jgi:predicted acyl esterase